MGRHKTPTEVLLRRGSAVANRPNRQNEVEIPVPASVPEAPDWLSEGALPHWKRLSKMLFDRGVLTEFDTMKLALLCDRLGDYLHLRAEIRRDGWTTTNCEGGLASHPNVRAMQAAWKDVEHIATRFGLSPTERTNLVLTPTPGAPAKPAHRFFAKG